MIQNLFVNFLQILIGFSGGLAVGAGFVAFITVLGIIPRLVQLSKTEKLIKVYSASVILGLLMGTYFSFAAVNLHQPIVVLLIWGLFHGIFNGMLAAALTEVLNVFNFIPQGTIGPLFINSVDGYCIRKDIRILIPVDLFC